MESDVVYCLCRQTYDPLREMVQCSHCEDWFHISCVGMESHQIVEIEKYHCPNCEPTRGASLYRQRTNWHRLDYWETDAETKPVQTGTAIFIKELKTRHFPSCESIIKYMKGCDLTQAYMQQHGFDVPILISEKDGLGLVVPSIEFGVNEVETLVGSDYVLDVIDVARQVNIRLKLAEFVKYFTSPTRVTTLNVISLEFSRTKLAPLVEAPKVARALDWVSYVWPKPLPGEDNGRPCVQKYCLISMKDSFTDFHIDFGGSSVWYHVLWGEKVFYLIKPTPANLSLYQRWQYSSTMSEDFFGDQVDMCYKCVVRQGQTMLIPTGWIHAVFTPMDTLVFGGNFLHSLNLPLQLQVYEIEKKIGVPSKFLFPSFEVINWYAAKVLLEELKSINSISGMNPQPHLLAGVKALTTTLKTWINEKDSNRNKHDDIPTSIVGYKICKELNKEVRVAERTLNLLNPPKPERESKRKKKKPMNKDFIDFSHNEPALTQFFRAYQQFRQRKMLFLPNNPEICNLKDIQSIRVVRKDYCISKSSVNSSYDTKQPLKLTLKAVKPPTPAPATPGSRPSIRLTLPLPSMYPYTTRPGTPDRIRPQVDSPEETPQVQPAVAEAESPVLVENRDKSPRRPWTVLIKNDPTTGTDENSTVDGAAAGTDGSKKGPFLKFKLGREPEKIDSVYDFHDDSNDDDCLMIDELPKRKRRYSIASGPSGSLKMRLPNLYGSKKHGLNTSGDPDSNTEVDVVSDLPKNGIEELLKASCYANEPTSQAAHLEDIESGRASPSTREAIAGMLSISRSYVREDNGKNQPAGSRSPRNGRKFRFSDDYGENMDKVHQDDEFVYPTLDASDDEEVVFKSRGRRKQDEPWNPKARVGPLVPKTDRPLREGTKKQAVEKGLEAAAAKRAGLPPAKRPYNRKKVKQEPVPVPPAPVIEKKIKMDTKSRKPRKGMATAKQRLGKILKIHKMKF